MPEIAVIGGFLIGLGFGAVGLLSGFCLLSSLRDWWGTGNGLKLRTFVLAVAVAIVGTQALAASGLVEIDRSLYLQPSFSAPLIFAGGLLFGVGMALANACASRSLVLLGKGNLRSLLVLLLVGIAGQMTLKGLLAPARLATLQWTQVTPASVSLPGLLGLGGIDAVSARIIAAVVVGLALLAFVFSDQNFRKSIGAIAAGLAMGLFVIGGWLTTGWLAADEFNPIPLASITFVSPVAETVQYVMLSTGLNLNFGIALVAGVLVGSFSAALLSGKFELEGFLSPPHMLRSVAGALLMGIGGALAYGCSIGQGLTGLSTLGLPSLIAVGGMVAGAAVALRSGALVPKLATR
jgi:uncharacterized membrane protein YedE/YeeE